VFFACKAEAGFMDIQRQTVTRTACHSSCGSSKLHTQQVSYNFYTSFVRKQHINILVIVNLCIKKVRLKKRIFCMYFLVDPILSQLNPVHTASVYLRYNSAFFHLCLGLPNRIFLSVLAIDIISTVSSCFLPFMLHAHTHPYLGSHS